MHINKDKYPFMSKYLTEIKPLKSRNFIGREAEIDMVLVTLNRREISNVALVGEAGTGKTTVVRGVIDYDKKRHYYEVQTSLLSASDGVNDGATEMGSRLTRLVSEVEAFQKESDESIVLFIDEFHVIMEISNSAMEALKPILSNSGERNIKLIIATTNHEYNQFVRKNSALNERLERVMIPEPDTEMTFRIIENMFKRYLPDEPVDDILLRRLITITDLTMPSQMQPRKSIRLLDAMISWHDTFGLPINDKLLEMTVKKTLGVNVSYQLDVKSMAEKMNNRVFDQPLAVKAFTDRIYLSVSGLRDKEKPRGSFLFTGPTGVGKTQLAKEAAKHLFGSEKKMIRFDMSEFSPDRAGAVDVLQKALTQAVIDNHESLILLDEIEKGSSACHRLFLQVLDDAQLTNEYGLPVSFKDTYIIFTTNEGAGVFESVQRSSGTSILANKNKTDADLEKEQSDLLKQYDKLIRRSLENDSSGSNGFPVELLGRLDKIVAFAPLNENTRQKIFKLELKNLKQKVYQEYGCVVHLDARVMRFIVEEGVGSNSTKNGGGREVMTRIEDHISVPISKFLGDHPNVSDISVVVDGVMSIEDEFDAKGNATIRVGVWSGSNSIRNER